MLLNCNSIQPSRLTLERLLSRFTILCLIDVQLPSTLTTNFYCFTSARTKNTSSICFLSSSVNVQELSVPISLPYCAALQLPTLSLVLCYLPPRLSLTKVQALCHKIQEYQLSSSSPLILLGDLNIPHPENHTAISARAKPRSTFLLKFLRQSHLISLGAQSEKRCVDWICPSAAALYLVNEVKLFSGAQLGSFRASDHSAWCLSLQPIVKKKLPRLTILTHKATKNQRKDFGNYLMLTSLLLSLPDDIDLA